MAAAHQGGYWIFVKFTVGRPPAFLSLNLSPSLNQNSGNLWTGIHQGRRAVWITSIHIGTRLDQLPDEGYPTGSTNNVFIEAA